MGLSLRGAQCYGLFYVLLEYQQMKHERNERDTGKKRLRDSDIDKEARQIEIETE